MKPNHRYDLLMNEAEQRTEKRERIRLRIELGLMAATVVAIFISMLQYCSGVKSTDAAIKAANISEEALKDARRSDTIAGIEARRRFVRDSINAQAQITALNDAVDELRKQYQLEN